MFSSLINFVLFHTPFYYLIQSVWRDEAFSYFMAKPNIIQIIINTASDFNPPLYYLLLNFWMQIVGKSDEGLRLLSFFLHLICAYISYFLAKKITDKKFAFFVFLFTLFNPMLLYYSFEMRMYSLYAFLTMASLYFFYLKNWKWYTITAVLGLYTHSFFILVVVSLILFLLLFNNSSQKNIFKTAKPLLFFLPWLPVLFLQFIRSKDSWIFPVDVQLIKSVLANLFTSYEGTPGNWWNYTATLSFIILVFFYFGFRKNKKLSLMFLTPIFVPLFFILGYSVIRRPIYVNRYMIFVTVFEIMAISIGIYSISNKLIRYLVLSIWFSFIIYLNCIFPQYHKKTDFKSTFQEINRLAIQTDFVYAQTPIGFLESVYYYQYPDQVFVYNPQNITIPYYIGATVVFPNISKQTFPPAPSKTFLIHDDSSFEIIINQ